MKTIQATTIDAYIASFPDDVQKKLESMRATIKKVAPNAVETIKYAMPTFELNGNLVHFAAFKNHIGFYPAPTGIKEFAEALSPYASGKGSIQFPLDQPLPLSLVSKIVKYRVKENLGKKNSRSKKK